MRPYQKITSVKFGAPYLGTPQESFQKTLCVEIGTLYWWQRAWNAIYACSATQWRRDHWHQVDGIVRKSEAVVGNPTYDFVFVHIPLPHGPPIYNRRTTRIALKQKNTYVDNLVLADKVLGRLREQMERAQLWERSTVLVTSDHWWGYSTSFAKDHRVPFILKMAKAKRPLPMLNSLLLMQMLLGT